MLPYNEKLDMALRSDSHTKRLLQCLKLYNNDVQDNTCIPAYIPRISPNLSASELYIMAERVHGVGVGKPMSVFYEVLRGFSEKN